MSEQNGLMYKGHPLMRKDNMVYYGSMASLSKIFCIF